MIAAITFCFSMVALGQFGLYYWRASIANTASRANLGSRKGRSRHPGGTGDVA